MTCVLIVRCSNDLMTLSRQNSPPPVGEIIVDSEPWRLREGLLTGKQALTGQGGWRELPGGQGNNEHEIHR